MINTTITVMRCLYIILGVLVVMLFNGCGSDSEPSPNSSPSQTPSPSLHTASVPIEGTPTQVASYLTQSLPFATTEKGTTVTGSLHQLISRRDLVTLNVAEAQRDEAMRLLSSLGNRSELVVIGHATDRSVE